MSAMRHPTVSQLVRVDFLAQDNQEFEKMSDELWSGNVSPERRKEIHTAIDNEIDRLSKEAGLAGF